MNRRDYNRWQPWMGYTLCGLCLFICVAAFAVGFFILGAVAGVGAVASVVAAHR